MMMVSTILTTTVSVSKSLTIPLQQSQTNMRQPRLSIADSWSSYNYREPSGPGTYSFGYDIDDPATNNVQFRNEERHPNGTVSGSYGYVDPDGNVRVVNYVADERGYRATEEKGFKLSMLKPIPLEEYSPFFPALTSVRSKPLPSTAFAPQRSPQVIPPSSKFPEEDQRINGRPTQVASLLGGTSRRRYNTLPTIVVNTPPPHQDRRFVIFNRPDNVLLNEDLYEPNGASDSEFGDDHYLLHDPTSEDFPDLRDASELGELFRYQDGDSSYYYRPGYFGEPRRFPQPNY